MAFSGSACFWIFEKSRIVHILTQGPLKNEKNSLLGGINHVKSFRIDIFPDFRHFFQDI